MEERRIPEALEKRLIQLLGQQGYVSLRDAVRQAMNQKKVIHFTDERIILKNSERITELIPSLHIMHRRYEKKFLRLNKMVKEDERQHDTYNSDKEL